MPTDACQFFYDCKGCAAVLRPNAGDCCVYCSFGDVPCPPIQEARASGSTASCCAWEHPSKGNYLTLDRREAHARKLWPSHRLCAWALSRL